MNRPPLNKNISLDDFSNYYWLKEELVSLCKQLGINSSGGKIEISKRIEHFLATGFVEEKISKRQLQKHSNFNWNTEPLSLSTIITDNYKNTQNVRTFFTQHIGKHFSFNVSFMNWMKENTGKTLESAINEWNKIHNQRKDKSNQTEIAPQFEYNKYIRAFLADNPDKTIKEAISCWKRKRNKKGTNEYERGDLEI